jgi:hypothetical protein
MQERHESCCAVYNMPAYPNGPCDCMYRELNEIMREVEKFREADNQIRKQIGMEPTVDEAIEKAVAACMRDDR